MGRRRVSRLTHLAILAAFPRGMRAEYGQDMIELLGDQTDRARSTGKSVLPLLILAIWDAVLSGFAQRWQDLHARRRKKGQISHPAHGNGDDPPRHRGRGIATILSDLRLACRALVRCPSYSIPSIFGLALGIGATTAAFSVLYSVILSPLPYDEPENLVRVYAVHPEAAPQGGVMSGGEFVHYRENLEAFESVAAMFTYRRQGATLTGLGVPVRVSILPVSADYFSVYRVQPALGRGFLRSEETSSDAIIILSHELHANLAGERESLIGETVLLDDRSYEVVGVLPQGFRDVVGGQPDIWRPLDMEARQAPNAGNSLTVIGRLAPGFSIEEAQAQIDVYHAGLDKSAWDEYFRLYTTRAVLLHEDVVGSVNRVLGVLMGAAVLVLLIVCVNVTNLGLARNLDRVRELAVRSALGAGRRRLVQAHLAEGVIVALLGGVAGVILANIGVDALLAIAPQALPRSQDIGLSSSMLGFSLAVTLVCGAIVGVLPALRFSKPRLVSSLASGSRSYSVDKRSTRLREALVASQVTLALVLLVGAGLLTRSMVRLNQVDLGMTPGHVTTFEVHLPRPRYDDWAKRARFHNELQDRLTALPGVEAAGAVSWLPVSGGFNNWGHPYTDDNGQAAYGVAQYRVVEGDYFEAMGIPIKSGRAFESSDDIRSYPVAMINEEMARRYYSDVDPLGQMIPKLNNEWRVIGVLGNVALDHRGNAEPEVYLHHSQVAWERNWALTHVIATSVARGDMVQVARDLLAEVDPGLVLHNPRTVEGITDAALARERFALLLLGVFAGVALLVACAGIYGVMAYSVGQRTREMGIRMALGASPVGLILYVGRRIGLLIVLGLAGGIVAAVGLSHLLESMLFGVSATDPVVLLAGPLILAVVGLFAGYLPARRAAVVDPVLALRSE